MATLFERIIDHDIPRGFIQAIAGEISRGRVTPADVAVRFGLTTEQQADWTKFLTLLNAHPDKVYFGQVVGDILWMSDYRVSIGNYRDDAAFWARLEEEVVLAGGVVPA